MLRPAFPGEGGRFYGFGCILGTMPRKRKSGSRPETSAEARRLLTVLKTAMRVLGYSNRQIERKMGLSDSYLSRVFSEAIELRISHIIEIARIIGVEPVEIFQLAFPERTAQPTAAGNHLREALKGMQKVAPASWEVPAPPSEPAPKSGDGPPAPVEGATESEVDKALEKMLARALQRIAERVG